MLRHPSRVLLLPLTFLLLDPAPLPAQPNNTNKIDVARGPALPAHEDRACRADADCALLGTVCPTCAPCAPRHEYAREQCPRLKCARCPAPVKWIGRKVACRQHQCVVVP